MMQLAVFRGSDYDEIRADYGLRLHESPMIWLRRPSGTSLSVSAEQDTVGNRSDLALVVIYQGDDPLVMLSPAEARSIAAALVSTADRIEGTCGRSSCLPPHDSAGRLPTGVLPDAWLALPADSVRTAKA